MSSAYHPAVPEQKRKSSPRVARVVIACEVCGKERSCLPSQVRARKTIRFSSTTCAGIGREKAGSRASFVCAHRGKQAEKRRDHLRERNYCSPACANAGRRVEGARWRDPDQIRAYQADYYSTDRAKAVDYARRWGQQNPERKRATRRRRGRDVRKRVRAASPPPTGRR